MSLLLLFSQGVNASASLTEDDDSLVSTATVLVSATASITEAADSVAATTTALVSASAAITEAADSLVSTATVVDSASEASTEADDSVAATVTSTISATASIAEADDSVSALVGVVSATMGGGSGHGRGAGSYSRREVDRHFREYLKKQKRRDDQVAAEIANQAKVTSIAALVDYNATAAVLTDEIKANDDEEAIMVLLLAA